MRPGLSPSVFERIAVSYWASVMSWLSTSARSTSSRRSSAACGLWNGSYTDGACGSPAKSADSSSVSWLAGFEKYVCDAASTP